MRQAGSGGMDFEVEKGLSGFGEFETFGVLRLRALRSAQDDEV